ncbi:hypothetical protein K7472_30295 [Streptomyces sp. PTM05]|uniref:Uncharacterized protein n=1 Tax=Streptantibioticus parmotrematis TaxID=2873249 RepID=A0ABS7R0V6_9ACTN|nr:hypothetical protein [Streptantibioticus parmotrematis]MBY8889104.1 hypothetical protein [Streptantibioticus parmotrematis]
MALPAWLTSQIAAAQAEADAHAQWSAFALTDDGLAQLVSAHDRADAQRWLEESGRTGIVAPSRAN